MAESWAGYDACRIERLLGSDRHIVRELDTTRTRTGHHGSSWRGECCHGQYGHCSKHDHCTESACTNHGCSSSDTTVRDGSPDVSEIPVRYDHSMPRIPEVPSIVWQPDENTVAETNIGGLMESHGFSSFEELHEWSVSDPEAFWREVIEELDIEFSVPPTRVLGSLDPTNPDWLPNAQMNIVVSCLDEDPNSAAIISGGSDGLVTTTVGELSSLVANFAAGLERAGFSAGDAVAIVMPMNREAVAAYLGIIAAGGVVVSIADSFAPEEIAARIAIANAKSVVTQSGAMRMGRDMRLYEKCLEADAPMCIVVGGQDLRAGDIGWDEFVVTAGTLDVVMASASAHINILFSSGTTGEPKAIPWTQTTPIKSAMDGRYHQDIRHGDVVAWPTNLGWMMGPWLIFASLLNGSNDRAVRRCADDPRVRRVRR